MRRVFGDALWSAGGLIVLLLILVALDDRVRVEVATRIVAAPVATVSQTGAQATGLLQLLTDVARDQATTHTPLFLFAFAGMALVLFMIRS